MVLLWGTPADELGNDCGAGACWALWPAGAEKFANRELNSFAMSLIEPLLEKLVTGVGVADDVATELMAIAVLLSGNWSPSRMASAMPIGKIQ